MLFGPKISYYECKDYLLNQLKILEPQLENETSKSITIKLICKSRVVTISLCEMSKGIITLDVDDSYYLLRIPKQSFKKFDQYKNAVINVATKLYYNFGVVENP